MNEKQISLAKQRLMNRRFNAYLNAPKKYDGIDFTPPQGVRDAAIRALKKRAEQPPSKRGMTAVGIARARDLSNGVTLSPDTIKRMVAYFTRHEVDKQGSTWEEYGKGRQAWDGWGGDAGYTWAKKILAQMERADEKEKALTESTELADVPKKYLTGSPYGTKGDREEEIKDRRDNKKTDYSPLPGDEEGSKRQSKYSKTEFADKVREEMKDNTADEFLRVASKISDIPKSILAEVHKRGAEAWATSGHRVGATQAAWSRARVYSFVTGGKTRSTADKDLWDKYKEMTESSVMSELEMTNEKEKALSETSMQASNHNDIKAFRERIKMGEVALYPGSDIKVLSVGKVNSRINGKTIQDVTPEILAEIVRVFKERSSQDPVIIDWNHQSSPFMDNGPTAPAQSMAYGEISDVYVKDDALYVKPLYTQAGLDLVKASEGVLYPSPEFLVGEVYAREGDPKPIGFAQLQAVTLTARPAQSKNKISRVLLMENIMNPEELKAMTADQLVALVLEKDQLVKQLEAQLEGVKSENDELTKDESAGEIEISLEGEYAKKDEKKMMAEEDKKMMEDEKKMSEASALSEKAQAKLMNELNAQVTALSEQVKTLQAEKHQAERKLVIDGLLNTGKIAPSEISAVESAYDIKDKFPAIWQSFSERKANQAINLSEKGHASTAQEISFIDQVNEIKKAKGITFSEALNVMRTEQPDAYIKHFKG
jgi:hypothetical protein